LELGAEKAVEQETEVDDGRHTVDMNDTDGPSPWSLSACKACAFTYGRWVNGYLYKTGKQDGMRVKPKIYGKYKRTLDLVSVTDTLY
jgi:hypothetical protein